MTKYKVCLAVPVKLTATLELTIEADNEDHAWTIAVEEYKRQQKEYEDALKEYHRTFKKPYPECPFFWHVDEDDIEANMETKNIDIDTVKEVKP